VPAKPGSRTTINIGEALLERARGRAREEGRELSDLIGAAVRAYLDGPPRPREAVLPGLVPPEPGLRSEVQNLMAELRQWLPQVAAVVANHGEVMDTLDDLTTELGRHRGVALALERLAQVPDRGKTG
jgi:hypothetical protein